MGKPTSSDLRERIVRGVEAGHSRRAMAEGFEVAPSTMAGCGSAGASPPIGTSGDVKAAVKSVGNRRKKVEDKLGKK